MTITRRDFVLASGTLAAMRSASAASKGDGLKISVPDWSLKKAGSIEAIGLAKELGFQGVELALGRPPVDNKLPADRDDLLAKYLEQARAQHIGIVDVCLDILHRDCLKNNPQARTWVLDAIRIAGKLGVKTILMPCAFKCGLAGEEINQVADVLKELAPHAENAGVIFGMENFLSAEDNVRVMERSRSDAVKVFYDVGNSESHGFDVVKEIRWLGKDRICMIHLKDGESYLGEGKINFPEVIRAIEEIGYRGYLSLETPIPGGSLEDGMRRNIQFIRGLLGA